MTDIQLTGNARGDIDAPMAFFVLPDPKGWDAIALDTGLPVAKAQGRLRPQCQPRVERLGREMRADMKTCIASIDVDRLIDIVNEAFEARYDYRRRLAVYYKKHGYGIRLDEAKTNEQRHIAYAYHTKEVCDTVFYGCVDILRLNGEQIGRLYTAARAAKKWYEATKWERIMPDTLQERLYAYIVGKKSA